MGEKEIKPAGASAGGAKVVELGPVVPPGGKTISKPGTGSTGDVKEKEPPKEPKPPKDAGPGKPWSGSAKYPDGFTMSREESGEVSLSDPDGTRATWDKSSERWTGPDGKPMPEDWSAGHRPTKYETGLSN